MTPIYFVIPKHHQHQWTANLKNAAIGKASVTDVASDLVSGVDVWILQTWMILSSLQDTRGFTFKLVSHAVPKSICVFHYDNAKPCYGLFNCYPIVIQADRPKVPFAAIRILQNPACTETSRAKYLYLWPQPGLIPRNVHRGETIEQLSIPGNAQYLHPDIYSSSFRGALKDMNVTLKIMNAGNWSDYSTTDLILAWRPNVPKRVLHTKPPSKLINAWHAKTPALLGPEPAYKALRQHQDDYFEIHSIQDILQIITQLKETPEKYRQLLSHYEKRAQEYTQQHLIEKWFALFTYIQTCTLTLSKIPLTKYSFYFFRKTYNQLLKHFHIWKD